MDLAERDSSSSEMNTPFTPQTHPMMPPPFIRGRFAQMLSERRLDLVEVSRRDRFPRHRRPAARSDTVAVEVVARDREAGTSPIFARRRQIADRDDHSFDTHYSHFLKPSAEAIVSSVQDASRSQITGDGAVRRTLFIRASTFSR